ncbi:hypothetical protein FJM67_04785 [Maribrevibacterium harenarium]|uniref:Uncharacterized protein n=1 Tax=Maribrevibacterium harenarium TaxID=2589817 RepID=A0A501WXQ4_9GAMM|nr:TnsD family Tn7-like transposition protein [Maribrevibacterium harenarium]TPE54268.1 hypothetical protein FJM67_04785 [Maribrevibacterium harenarium]
MIYQFPVPHDDELLGSVLARFISRQGIREDKVALALLFGSRNIVPSALLQGHLSCLANNVQNLWPITPNEMIENHSILPIFKPFVEFDRYTSICTDLTLDVKSHSMLKVGINASSLVFPAYFRFCPVCFNEDMKQFAYSYWRRQFQLPGVCVCLQHRCMLMDSHFELKPSRRHAFIEASALSSMPIPFVAEVCQNPALLELARNIDRLLHQSFPYIAPNQWTVFYDARLREVGLKSSKGVDHELVKSRLIQCWGNSFLTECGLEIDEGVTWLQTFFRKQRKHFSYLHHLLCIQALLPEWRLDDVFRVAQDIQIKKSKQIYSSSRADLRAPEYRTVWYELNKTYASLKDIRATREGARVYSWLYRFDHDWLKSNLPSPLRNNVGRVVNWKQRDRALVRHLINIRREHEDNLELPRMTQNWFISQLQVRWGIEKHLAKLPLCRQFFVKYAETIEEYQVRRIIAIITECIDKGKPIPQAYEIERSTGLSKNRIREAPRQIIREYLKMVPGFKLPPKEQRAG